MSKQSKAPKTAVAMDKARGPNNLTWQEVEKYLDHHGIREFFEVQKFQFLLMNRRN